MSNHSAPPSSRGGLSLYANLLDPSSSSNGTSATSISKAPVVFKQDSDEGIQGEDTSVKKPQINPAALRFQPTKRPQLTNQKPKLKSAFPKAPVQPIGESVSNTATSSAPRIPAKSTLADWTVTRDDDDTNEFYGGEKRQRGGRKRRKKHREEHTVVQDWDDIYDPARPNNYDEYKHSNEKIREVRDWKDRLYSHRMVKKYSSDIDSDDELSRPRINQQYAPPSTYSFAPPPPVQPPSQEPAHITNILNNQTGEDAYVQRLKLSQANVLVPPPPPKALYSSSDIPLPPIPESAPSAVISRAPVRYNLPLPPMDIPSSEAELEKALGEEEEEYEPPETVEVGDAPRSLRPGQKGFAERLMSKYGWSKGTGLGADGSGIVNPLRVQVEKRRKKPDSEGGGFADPKGVGKIVGGKKNSAGRDSENGKFGAMSEVIILRGMVDGMDLDEEVGDGGLIQEIGDECSEKYGRVERVYIDRHGNAPANVFVKFTSQLSGLRAVNALEGRIFNGNTISAMFFDAEKFERGIFK